MEDIVRMDKVKQLQQVSHELTPVQLLTINGINPDKTDDDHKNNNTEENGQDDKLKDKDGNGNILTFIVKSTGWRRYIGIIFALCSSLLYTLIILIVKALPQYNPYTTTFWRYLGALLPSIPLMFYFRAVRKEMIFDMMFPITAPGHPKTLFLLFVRVLTGTSAFILQCYSLEYISMADSTVIAVSTPVFISLASHFLLGEKSGVIPVMCGVITLGGVAIITRPPILTGAGSFDRETLSGTGLAFGCMFCIVISFIILRHFRQMHFSVTIALFGLWGCIQSVGLSVTLSEFQIPKNFQHWWMAVALAICAFLEQIFITLAFKYEQAGICSLCRTCDVPFAFLWQFIFLGKVPDLWSLVGGGVVIFGVLMATIRKYLSELPEDSRSRKRFWILLV